MTLDLIYTRGSLDADEINEAVRDSLQEYQTDPELQAKIGREADVPVDAIKVQNHSSNLDPATATLIVAFAGPVFLDVWRHILLPRLKSKLGNDAIGDERKGPIDSNE